MTVAYLSNRPERRGQTRIVVEHDGQRAEADLPPREVDYVRAVATSAKLTLAQRVAGVRLRDRVPLLFEECDGRGTPCFALVRGIRTCVSSDQRDN